MNAYSGNAKLILLAAVAACTPSSASELSVRTLEGEAVQVGAGSARTYVQFREGSPVEVGVILSETALNKLPGAKHSGGTFVHGHTTFETVLTLPADNPTPYRHVLVNWNPGGHEPPGIYDTPHLDFHFYTIDNAQRLAIDPADPTYQAKAERQPSADLIPDGYILPAPLAFPRMGVHWVDPKSPELNGKPFTSTFIYGSWNGEIIFAEPMLTKEFLESKQNVLVSLPEPDRYGKPGYYPTSYSVRWDPATKEYRIALTGLTRRS